MQLHRLCSTAASAAPLLAIPLFASMLFAPLAQAQDAPVFKRLAGPPEEFAAMRAVEPVASAIQSKSALIRVELDGAKVGSPRWQGSFPAEGERLRFAVFSGDADWGVELESPNGVRAKAAGVRETGSLGLGDAQLPMQQFDVAAVGGGNWSLTLRGDAAKAGASRGFVLLEGEASTELSSWRTDTRQKVGDRIGVTAMLTSTPADGSIALGNHAGGITLATLEVTRPDGSMRKVRMFDDGLHDDGAAGDGLFAGSFNATAAGDHIAQVVVHGVNREGRALLRTAEHIVPVVERSIELAGTRANGAKAQDGRIAIQVPVATAKSGGPSHYRAWAEVWGSDAMGAPVAVAWVGGMVSPTRGALELELDERWVARAKAKAPFELRNLRIEHPDSFATVADARRLALELPALPKAARGDVAIDQAMLMGTPPAGLAMAKGTGSRLLLVHGYCSGGVWPTTHFTNASTFLDRNQNRSHDQFARLIQSFGSTWNSFGIVAHSQGGAAALHLYTYYWSGLDYASGNRLIQSVGTPYQGTNLSGILAAVGSWFGVGCGSNSDLQYGGAASWLAGIPSWARGKVNYYTTAFRTTNWWTNDYCNFASDLVLSDPEDGTTEKAYGQLPYGINRGHTSGQCHTTGMRDPAQYLDSYRNSVMNSNAAR